MSTEPEFWAELAADAAVRAAVKDLERQRLRAASEARAAIGKYMTSIPPVDPVELDENE